VGLEMNPSRLRTALISAVFAWAEDGRGGAIWAFLIRRMVPMRVSSVVFPNALAVMLQFHPVGLALFVVETVLRASLGTEEMIDAAYIDLVRTHRNCDRPDAFRFKATKKVCRLPNRRPIEPKRRRSWGVFSVHAVFRPSSW